MLEVIQVAILVMTNVFVVLNTILILKYVYGRDMRYDAKSLLITALAFLGMDILISLLPQEMDWLASFGINTGLLLAVILI